MPAAKRGTTLVRLALTKKTGNIAVYAPHRVADALKEIVQNASLYDGVRLTQILETVYNQGKKDGRREVFERVESVKKELPHQNPGRPRKRQ